MVDVEVYEKSCDKTEDPSVPLRSQFIIISYIVELVKRSMFNVCYDTVIIIIFSGLPNSFTVPMSFLGNNICPTL